MTIMLLSLHKTTSNLRKIIASSHFVGMKPGKQSTAFPKPAREKTHKSTHEKIQLKSSTTHHFTLQVCVFHSTMCLSSEQLYKQQLSWCHLTQFTLLSWPPSYKRLQRVNSLELSWQLSLPHTKNVNKVLFRKLNSNHWHLEGCVWF